MSEKPFAMCASYAGGIDTAAGGLAAVIHRADCHIIAAAVARAGTVMDEGTYRNGDRFVYRYEAPVFLTRLEAARRCGTRCKLCAPDVRVRPAIFEQRGSGLGWPKPDGSCVYTPLSRGNRWIR